MSDQQLRELAERDLRYVKECCCRGKFCEAWGCTNVKPLAEGVLALLSQVETLTEAAKPVVRKWREGKSCPDEIALLDVALEHHE